MALCRFQISSRAVPMVCWGWHESGVVWPLHNSTVTALFEGDFEGGIAALRQECMTEDPFRLNESSDEAGRSAKISLLAPILHNQEVWAAGVTYESSKFARMAESEEAGDYYARVYVADRPELFFKSTPGRVVGTGGDVRIRVDSAWNVPEPELAAVVSATGEILGYTIGNDMSSRDIEGANPLYLPQAKVYRQSCSLGPWIVGAGEIDPHNLSIRLSIARGGETIFTGETSTARMKRKVDELVEWSLRENEFPNGFILLTGTGIIPPPEFTLEPGDSIGIAIEGIGTLYNRVVRGEATAGRAGLR